MPGSTIPLDGRTANFFGAVVLSLKATRSEPGLWRLSVAVTFLRSSKRKRSSDATQGWGAGSVSGTGGFSRVSKGKVEVHEGCLSRSLSLSPSPSPSFPASLLPERGPILPGSSWRSSPAAMMLCFSLSVFVLRVTSRKKKEERKKGWEKQKESEAGDDFFFTLALSSSSLLQSPFSSLLLPTKVRGAGSLRVLPGHGASFEPE